MGVSALGEPAPRTPRGDKQATDLHASWTTGLSLPKWARRCPSRPAVHGLAGLPFCRGMEAVVRRMSVRQTIAEPGHHLCSAGERLVVEGHIYRAPVQGPPVRRVATKCHVIVGPGWPLEGAARLRDRTEVCKQLGGLCREGRGQNRCHRSKAFSPQINVCDEAPARALGMAACALRLHLPRVGQELPDVYVFLC